MNRHYGDAHVRGYTIIKEVGSGSFGKAYLVKKNQDPKGSDKEYCMKIISLAKMSDKERREAMQEAKLLANLKHPYIVAFRESWIDEGRLCIVMDYAEGGDLHKKIQTQRRLGRNIHEKIITRWLTQACLAIKHLHERKILHRDIKSSNFFLTAEGRLRIGDFGIAKELAATDAMARTTIGTPYYLAPEICKERPYSWTADMWSLGVVLYELCALKVPYDAPNIKSLVEKIVKTEAPKIPSCYSAGLQEITSSLLQKDPKARPSAHDLLAHPLLQAEIRSMLNEEREKKKAAEPQAVNAAPAPVSANPTPTPSQAAAAEYMPSSRGPTPPSSARNHYVPAALPSARQPSPVSARQASPSGAGALPRRPSNAYIPSVPSAHNLPSYRAPSPYGQHQQAPAPLPVYQPGIQRVPSVRQASPSSFQRDYQQPSARMAPPAYRAPSPSGMRNPIPSVPSVPSYSARQQVPSSRAASPIGSRNPTPVQRPVAVNNYYGYNNNGYAYGR